MRPLTQDTKISYNFDATKNINGEQINNLIMTVPLLDEDGAHADADGDDGFPLEMDFKRHVITIDTVVDKSAAGMASASLRSIEALAEPIDGLFERILAASIGAVVDHAALAEGRELSEKAKATLEEEAAGGGLLDHDSCTRGSAYA